MPFPCIIENRSAADDSSSTEAWLAEHLEGLKQTLAIDGAILFRGFPVRSPEAFDAFAAAFGYGEFTYEESLSNAVRINRTRRVFTANEAPPETEIFLHHEMAQTPVYPEKIFFCCLSAAERGGATPLCRSDDLFDAFLQAAPEEARRFLDLGVRYTTHMPGDNDLHSGQGRSWKSTLSVDDVDAAEARLNALGYSWRWQPDGSLMATTPVLPAVRTLADGRQSFFNQVIAAYRGWQRRDESGEPVLTYGNGEHLSAQVMDTLIALSGELTIPLEWQDGDVALVDNYRVMHGRFPYGGARKREVLVCLAREPT